VFSARGKGEYEFVSQKKNDEEVDWQIHVKDKTWELEHKQKVIGTANVSSHDVDNYEFKFNPSLAKPVKYGTGTLKITFNKEDTQFKIDREGPSGDRNIFAVYRCDEKTVGQGSGKVEIAQKEKRNFVLVIASLFCFVRMSATKANKRASMPEARMTKTTSPPKRPRSNSVDEKNKTAAVPKKDLVKKPDDTPKKPSTQSPKKSTGKKHKDSSESDTDSDDSSDESTESSDEPKLKSKKAPKKSEKTEPKEKTDEKDEKKDKADKKEKDSESKDEKPVEKKDDKKKDEKKR